MTTTATLPKTMHAAVVDAAGGPEAFHTKQVATPTAERDHMIIALEYAGVGSWDAFHRSGAWGKIKPGTVLGVDGSGTIAAVGPGVENFAVGDRVYSYSYKNPTGGYYAEYVSVPADRVARVPGDLKMATAGAMPCVALTALAGLESLHLSKKQTLLVFGASGGVGSMAVWLAHREGMTVIGTAQADAQEYVRHLGADHVVDANASQLDAVLNRVAPDGFDGCLVTANSKALPAFISHLKPKAHFAYPNGVEPAPKFPAHAHSTFDGEMSRGAWDRLNGLIGSHSIPLRTEVFSLKEVGDAHRRIEKGHVVGKIVLKIEF